MAHLIWGKYGKFVLFFARACSGSSREFSECQGPHQRLANKRLAQRVCIQIELQFLVVFQVFQVFQVFFFFFFFLFLFADLFVGFLSISCDNKIWRQVCLRLGWGGRITSTHAVRKKWKEVYIQHVMLQRQRRLQGELAKPSVLRGPKKLHVLLLGLDRVGKTTFVYRLKLNRKIVSIPTVGANRETVTKPFGALKQSTQQLERVFKFTDVGGITPMRMLWSEYLRVS